MPDDHLNEFGALEMIIPRDGNREIRERFDQCEAGSVRIRMQHAESERSAHRDALDRDL